MPGPPRFGRRGHVQRAHSARPHGGLTARLTDIARISWGSSPSTQPIPAAVLVPLFREPDSGAAHVVLTRRRADLRRHAGEISFPGGRQDPQDTQLSDTALREAEEEIGLARAAVKLLGDLPPTSTFATNYEIHPFIGVIPAGQLWRLSPVEVDAVLELSLQAVSQGRTRTQMERRGITFETDAYVVGDNLIWGATARILEQLLSWLSEGNLEARLAAS